MQGLAAQLRTTKQLISDRWEARVRAEIAALRTLTRGELVDHLPEFLEGLADWIEGNVEEARRQFQQLVDGHALQRHGIGVSLETLTAEYALLRRVIFEHIVTTADHAELQRSLVELAAGIDHAIGAAVQHYTAARDQVRERFIGILAHDLRNPLGAITMSATLLRDLFEGEREMRLVEHIERGCRRISEMIDNVLDFARGRLDGAIPVSPVLADMGVICAGAVDEARATSTSPPLELEVTGDLRGHWDPARVAQALANLIANARRHGRGAPVRVRAWEREDRHAVLTSVTNVGPPISPELLGRIFDPFARELRQGRGLGLGLFIVQQIALAHGGRCTVSSTAEATTFSIEWPRTPLDETPGRAAR